MPWQAERELVDSHARSYMAVSMYQSRLRMLAPPAVHGNVLALEFSRSLAKLLKGRERIYDVRSTRAAQRDVKRYVAQRDMLQAMDGMVQKALDQASNALDQLPELRPAYQGWFMILDRWYGLADFDEMLDSLEQFSRPYLQWIKQVRLASPQTQLAFRAYLDSEFHLHTIAENPATLLASIRHGTDEPKENADARKELARIGKAKSSAMRRLADVRSELFTATRFAFEESRVGRANDTKPYAAWPFPLRLTGTENGETLAAAVASYQVLGAWMMKCGASLRFVEFGPDAQQSDTPKHPAGAGQRAALAYWRSVNEAGEALVFLGAALHALVRVDAAPHCQLCFRHVGQGLRKYCDHHARPDEAAPAVKRDATSAIDTVHARTQHRQSQLLAGQFQQQFELLDAALARKPIWHHPTLTIERALSRCRRLSGRKPHEQGSNVAQRAEDIRAVVEALRPVLGEALYQRMAALQAAVTAWAAADADAVERRMESLTLGGFFAHWFSGFVQKQGPTVWEYRGSDPTHPMTVWKLIPFGKYNAPLRRSNPLNLDSIVRDLLLQRAWLEVGGEAADAALLKGAAPVPGLRKKGKVDLVEARQMRERDQLSYEAIGEKFGVSRAAVFLALQREVRRGPLQLKKG